MNEEDPKYTTLHKEPFAVYLSPKSGFVVIMDQFQCLKKLLLLNSMQRSRQIKVKLIYIDGKEIFIALNFTMFKI